MINRISDINSFIGIEPYIQERDVTPLIDHAISNDSIEYVNNTNRNDLKHLSDLLCYYKPRTILELGSYTGIISDFILSLLPDSKITSATLHPFMLEEIKSKHISNKNKGSYTGVCIPNTKSPNPKEVIDIIPDLIFISIDNIPLNYISYYTTLALKLHQRGNMIIWYGCNGTDSPGSIYLRCFDKINCIAYKDTASESYGSGLDDNERPELGFALWNEQIEDLLEDYYIFQ